MNDNTHRYYRYHQTGMGLEEVVNVNEFDVPMSQSMERRAYATFFTSDSYSIGVEALVYSLYKSGTSYPIVILYSLQVSEATRKKLERCFAGYSGGCAVHFQCVADIGIPALTDVDSVHVPGWVNSGYTKLNIFTLEDYDKIVYIDADALVLENVDELFDRPTRFAAAPDVFPPDRFNAGVLVIQPSLATFQELMEKANTLKSYDGGDTGFLNMVFPDWYQWDAASRLPFGYNAQRTMYWLVNDRNPGYWQAIQPLKILHFSSNPKPWEDPARKGDLELLWWQMYTESRCVMH